MSLITKYYLTNIPVENAHNLTNVLEGTGIKWPKRIQENGTITLELPGRAQYLVGQSLDIEGEVFTLVLFKNGVILEQNEKTGELSIASRERWNLWATPEYVELIPSYN